MRLSRPGYRASLTARHGRCGLVVTIVVAVVSLAPLLLVGVVDNLGHDGHGHGSESALGSGISKRKNQHAAEDHSRHSAWHR